MFKFRLFILVLIISLSPNIYSSDILDIYNRAIKYNNDLRIISNDNNISEELYDQTSSSLLPEIGITASTQENYTNKYSGTGDIKDYTTETASLTITQPILRIYFFDELNKAEANLDKSKVRVDGYKKDLIIKSAELYFSLINSNNAYKASIIKSNMTSLSYKNAKKLFINGYITNVELNKYKNNFDIAKIESDISKNKLELAKQDIYILTGREALDIHDLKPIMDIDFRSYNSSSLLSKAMRSFDAIKLALLDVDISKYEWKLYDPTILINGEQNKEIKITLKSNFDLKKINSLFSNLSSLTLIELFDLRKSYKNLNYSLIDIDSHLYKIASYPLYLTLITILSAIIMFNIGYQKNSFFKITFGILLSVIIYYVNYFLNVLGTNEKIPLILSIFMPLIILSIINFTSIIKINEK